jgi:protein-L-isoaspartate(D-aspartate) O-methyltransferase
MVALMTAELGLSQREKVLEIAGHGTRRRAGELALRCTPWGSPRCWSAPAGAHRWATATSCRAADGTYGWPEEAPFDAILVAAAAPAVPSTLTAQLGDNGVLVVPVGRSPAYQTLLTVRRRGASLEQREGIGCRFVPLVSPGP